MKLYVATRWENRRYARMMMFKLVEAGHTITYDWTLNEEASTATAQRDLQGVREADALVLLADLPNMMGAWVEFGAAAIRGIPIYVAGNADSRCIFLHLPNVHRGLEALLH